MTTHRIHEKRDEKSINPSYQKKKTADQRWGCIRRRGTVLLRHGLQNIILKLERRDEEELSITDFPHRRYAKNPVATAR